MNKNDLNAIFYAANIHASTESNFAVFCLGVAVGFHISNPEVFNDSEQTVLKNKEYVATLSAATELLLEAFESTQRTYAELIVNNKHKTNERLSAELMKIVNSYREKVCDGN